MDDQRADDLRPNWVAEEAASWLEAVLETLAVEFEIDVDAVNALPEEIRRYCVFRFQRSDPPGTSISATREDARIRQFYWTNARIDHQKRAIIVEPWGEEPFEVACEVSDDTGLRVLTVDGDPYRAWQISRKALGLLFFPIDQPR